MFVRIAILLRLFLLFSKRIGTDIWGDDTKVRKLSGWRSCGDARAFSNFELEHDFQGASEVTKVALYRKALFRDRNQTRKRTLFTLEPRPDAVRGVFQPLNRRKFTLNALNCPSLGSLERDNSDTFVSSPRTRNQTTHRGCHFI
jgi:hypothetical protein